MQSVLSDILYLQETLWDGETEKTKLYVYEFRIVVKEDDANKCREVLPDILYLQETLWDGETEETKLHEH